MLLERLKEYAERAGEAIPPPGYEKTTIKWIIPLDGSGKAGPLIPTTGRGGKYDRGKEYLAPHRLRTSTAIRPKLLADNGEYTLGRPKSGVSSTAQRKRINRCHAAFIDLVRECVTETKEPTVQTVLKFLESPKSELTIPEDFEPSQNITFQVEGTLPIHLPAVKQFWAKYFWDAVLTGESAEDEDTKEAQVGVSDVSSVLRSSEMECIICGKITSAVPRHPFQIKGIPGRRAGAALISANSPSFESYGLRASLIAPTCRDCADVYIKSANLLIQSESNSISVGPCTYVFWTKDEWDFSPARLLSDPQPEEVKALIKSVFSGKQEATTIDSNPFYAVALTANRSRVVVRDWLETTVEGVRKTLARWFQLQAIIGEWGETDVFPFPIQGYWKRQSKTWVEGLAESLVPKVKQSRNIQELNPEVPTILLQVALKGGMIPKWLLFQAVRRNRLEQMVTRCRAALIKMVLLSQQESYLKEDAMTELELENYDPAYLCGRLLAVLERIQQTAIPGVTATITDRFFGTASSAPASVFGHLIRGAMAHLAKLRKEKPGTYEALRRKLSQLQEPLKTFPKTLTLEQQGLFGLGYFHQQAADRAALAAYRRLQENKLPQ